MPPATCLHVEELSSVGIGSAPGNRRHAPVHALKGPPVGGPALRHDVPFVLLGPAGRAGGACRDHQDRSPSCCHADSTWDVTVIYSSQRILVFCSVHNAVFLHTWTKWEVVLGIQWHAEMVRCTTSSEKETAANSSCVQHFSTSLGIWTRVAPPADICYTRRLVCINAWCTRGAWQTWCTCWSWYTIPSIKSVISWISWWSL